MYLNSVVQSVLSSSAGVVNKVGRCEITKRMHFETGR